MITVSDLNYVLSYSVYRPRASKKMHWFDLSGFFCIYSPSFSVYYLQSLRGSKLHSVTESLGIHFYENALGSITTPWMNMNWLNYEKVRRCFCQQGTFYMLRANEGNCSVSWTILILEVSISVVFSARIPVSSDNTDANF